MKKLFVRSFRRLAHLLFPVLMLVLFLSSLPGCAKFMGGLRRDLDDEAVPPPPTSGGQWSERGLLDNELLEDSPSSGRTVGHAERSPASQGYGDAGRRSWVDPDEASGNRRDQVRGMQAGEDGAGDLAYSNTPSVEPGVRRQYKNGSRATRADFVDESANEGSLWASDGQTNYYFTKNKIRTVGDIVSINIEDGLVRDLGVEVKRTLNDHEKDTEIALAQARLDGQLGDGKKDSVPGSAAAPARAPASDASNKDKGAAPSDGKTATLEDVDVSKSLDVKPGEVMMAEIVERYPNGNYKIRGTKKIPYRMGGARLVTLVGIARGSDIGEDDTVASGKLYEYRLKAAR